MIKLEAAIEIAENLMEGASEDQKQDAMLKIIQLYRAGKFERNAYQKIYRVCKNISNSVDEFDSPKRIELDSQKFGYEIFFNESIDLDLLREDLVEAINTLSEIEKDIIYYHFRDGMLLEQIGKLLGISREKVRRHERKALDKLKNICRNRGIDSYL